jgi:PAS domain S-box-containing protein
MMNDILKATVEASKETAELKRENADLRHAVDALEEERDKYRQMYLEAMERLKSQTTGLDTERAKLMAIFDNAPEGIIVTDTASRIIMANPAAEWLYGHPLPLGRGYKFYGQFFKPDGTPCPLSKLPLTRSALLGETVINEELQIVFHDGRRRDLLINSAPIRKSGKGLKGAIALLRDVTERKKQERERQRILLELQSKTEELALQSEALLEARDNLQLRVAERTAELLTANETLRSTQEFLSKLLDNAPALVYVTNVQGRIKMVNRAWEEFTGFKRLDAIDTPLESIFSPDTARRFRQMNEQIIEAESPLAQVEAIRIRKAQRYFHTVKFPLYDSAGMIEAIGGISVDVTEEMNAQQDLHAYTAKLEKINEELQEFAFVASHDLQEPLRKIQSFSTRLRSKWELLLGEEGCDYLSRVESAARRMSTLLSALLGYSRVATRATPFTPTDLSKVADDVLSDLELLVEDSGARVLVEQLPIIDADSDQMRQLLQNLLANAMKYRKSGVNPVVRVHGTVQEGTARIHVEDNGIGFDEKYQDRIFKPFQRLHGRSSEYEGIGMGLAICRKIVERHGGGIAVHSTPGEGSTFMITLPVEQPGSPANEA